MAARGMKQKACLLKVKSWRDTGDTTYRKTTKKRQNFDPSTLPACAEHLHFMLNGETRRAHGPPPDTGSQMAWEYTDNKVS
jgi:hypothetical protein